MSRIYVTFRKTPTATLETRRTPLVLLTYKYRSLMPSLALIFDLIDIADGKPSGPVSKGAAEKAAAWCDYLESHARRIYGLVSDITLQAASRLAKKVKSDDLGSRFSVRDVYRKNWGLLDDTEIALQACEELAALGWLRELQSVETGIGRSRSPTYAVNRKLGIREQN